jgi:hypothetical protein
MRFSRFSRLLWLPAALLITWAAGASSLRSPAGLRVERPHTRAIVLHYDFESGGLDAWQMPHREDWSILSENGHHYLHMNRSREPGIPRRPLQFALLRDVKVGSFEFSTRLRRQGRSMIIVFNYVDTLHFYYAHLSADSGAKEPVHNGIFIVDGGPRRRIAGLEAPPALPDREWHTAFLRRSLHTGSIELRMDDQQQPLFSVADGTFECGQVGIGSFDETGDFDDVTLQSRDAGCVSGGAR